VTRRFRLLAGPNGSGKSTLKRRLERDYAVNFYDFLNAVALPKWFECLRPSLGVAGTPLDRGTALEASAEAASREAVNEAFAAGLPITVIEGGKVVRVKEGPH